MTPSVSELRWLLCARPALHHRTDGVPLGRTRQSPAGAVAQRAMELEQGQATAAAEDDPFVRAASDMNDDTYRTCWHHLVLSVALRVVSSRVVIIRCRL